MGIESIRMENTVQPKRSELVADLTRKEKQERIFDVMSNDDCALVAGTISTLSGLFGLTRVIDVNVAKSVLKENANMPGLKAECQCGQALRIMKGAKWQIPVFLLTSLATGLLAKKAYDAK